MNKFELIVWLPFILAVLIWIAALIYYKDIETLNIVFMLGIFLISSFLWFRYWFNKSLNKQNGN